MQNLNERGAAYIPIAKARGITPHSDKKHMNLYEISSDYAKFIEAFDNGDIPEEAFADTLDSIHGAFEDKCVAVACSIKNDKVMFDALETEIAQLKKRKKVLERTIESKQQYLLDSMERAGVDKIKNNPRAQLRVSKNPPKIVFADKTAFLRQALAEDRKKYLIVQQPTLNESAIKGDLVLGAIIPGVHLEQGKRVDIS